MSSLTNPPTPDLVTASASFVAALSALVVGFERTDSLVEAAGLAVALRDAAQAMTDAMLSANLDDVSDASQELQALLHNRFR